MPIDKVDTKIQAFYKNKRLDTLNYHHILQSPYLSNPFFLNDLNLFEIPVKHEYVLKQTCLPALVDLTNNF